jgi:hypothetical protein
MKKLAERIGLICCGAVALAFVIGVLEVIFLNTPGVRFLGCGFGELAAWGCPSAPFAAVKEIILNMPMGFIIGPIFLFRGPSSLGFIGGSWWQAYLNPAIIYLCAAGMIAWLALAYVVWMIGRALRCWLFAAKPVR